MLLEISPTGGDPHPCFKSDGGRFRGAETTLKVVRRGKYKLAFVCSPPSVVLGAEILVRSLLGWEVTAVRLLTPEQHYTTSVQVTCQVVLKRMEL